MLDIFRVECCDVWFVTAASANEALRMVADNVELDEESCYEEIKINRLFHGELVEFFLELSPSYARYMFEDMKKGISRFYEESDLECEEHEPIILQTTEDSDNAEVEEVNMQETAIESAEAISFEEFLKIKKGFTYEDYQIFAYKCRHYGIGNALAYITSTEYDDNVPF